MLRTACQALAGTEAEVTAIDLVSHVPEGIDVTTLLASVRGIAAEYGCRASVELANGAMEVRLSRDGALRR
jgi:2-polyprenyl-3-methyl-5-hydroxy-6-metoxy-1,4-benzoquinol methylase